jgi:hypothetical protein
VGGRKAKLQAKSLFEMQNEEISPMPLKPGNLCSAAALLSGMLLSSIYRLEAQNLRLARVKRTWAKDHRRGG